MIEDGVTPRIECWLRENTPVAAYERQQAVVDRLYRLETTGQISSVTVHTWETQIRRPADDDRCEGSERGDWEIYRKFDQWATEADYALTPAFRRCNCQSLVGDVSHERITPPIVSLAVYDDQQLRAVAPCSTPEEGWNVEDCLAVLEIDHGTTDLAPSGAKTDI